MELRGRKKKKHQKKEIRKGQREGKGQIGGRGGVTSIKANKNFQALIVNK